MDNTEKSSNNLMASLPYIPAGGLQIIPILIGLFNSDKFVKFNSLQSLIYFILTLLIFWPFLVIIDLIFKLGTPLSGIFIISYIVGILFLVPGIITSKVYNGKIIYLPLIGRKIAHLCGYVE